MKKLDFFAVFFRITFLINFINSDGSIGKISSRTIRSNPDFARSLWRNCKIPPHFTCFICYNVDIALPESVIKIRGTGVGFSGRALLNSWKKLKINGNNGKNENIPIILVISSKFTGEFFSKTNITCEILFRSDSLKKKWGYRTYVRRYSSFRKQKWLISRSTLQLSVK